MPGKYAVLFEQPAQGIPFTRLQMNTLTDLAEAGIRQLIAAQQRALAS